jgi:hypothetical protein
MNEPTWKGDVLFDHERVLGWVGYESARSIWYARTAGTRTHPTVRGAFDNRESAEDFLQFITTVENTHD